MNKLTRSIIKDEIKRYKKCLKEGKNYLNILKHINIPNIEKKIAIWEKGIKALKEDLK